VLVVLVIADSVRADAPGFGGGEAQTAVLDQLAAEGTCFTENIASGGWTVPSLVSLVTGTLPHRVGVSRWRHPFPSHRPTLMSAFAAAGFEVHSLVHNPRFCLANTGFRGTVGDSEDPEAVLSALRAPSGSDRLVVIHHWWTHLPYLNEKIPRARWKKLCDEAISRLAENPEDARPRTRREYLDALEWFDTELMARYLDAARSGGDDLLLAFTADHGENWGESLPAGRRMEHIYDLHGRWLTEETTRVPLLLWGKGAAGPLPAGQRLGGLVRGVDLAPTLAGLAGIPWPGPLPGDVTETQVDRGIEPGTGGLVLDGESREDCIRSGRNSELTEALTVTSHNALVPARYPRAGHKMWSRFGLRTPERRYVWDGLYRRRDITELGDEEPDGLLAQLRDRWVDVPRVWSRMAEERRFALGPGPKLPRELFPRFGTEPEGDGADSPLEDAMRMLGYGD